MSGREVAIGLGWLLTVCGVGAWDWRAALVIAGLSLGGGAFWGMVAEKRTKDTGEQG